MRLVVIALAFWFQDADRERADRLMAEATSVAAQKTPEGYRQAAAKFEEAGGLWERLGERLKEFNAFSGAAFLRYPVHELAEMSRDLEKAQAAAGPDAEPRAGAALLLAFSLLHNERGEYALSIDELQKARGIYAGLGDPDSERQATSFLAKTYGLKGLAEEKAKEMEAALASRERGAALYREAGDGGGQANAWWGVANLYDSLGRAEEARQAYLKVLPFLADLKNERAEGLILKNLAMEEDSLKKLSDAVEHYRQALPLLRAAHDTLSQYLAGMKLGAALEALGKPDEALETYRNVAKVCREGGERADEAVAYSRIALVEMGARRWQDALDALGEQQKLFAGVGDRAGESLTWSQMASVYQSRGQYSEKLKADLRALALLEEGGGGSVDAGRREVALRSVGDSYSGLHNGPAALGYFERALAMNPADPNERALLLVEIGEVHYQMSGYEEALRYEEQALAIESQEGQIAFLERISNSMALAYQAAGETERAKEIFQKNLAQARERGDIQHQVTGLQNLGRLYQDAGEMREAEKLYDESLRLARGDDERDQAGTTLSSLGMVYSAEGREEEAVRTLKEALALQSSLGNANGESVALNNLALVYGYTGQPQKAVEAQNRALAIMREVGEGGGIASQLGNLGSLYQHLGDFERAGSYFEEALETYQELKDEGAAVATRNSLGVLKMNSGDARAAIGDFEQALEGARKFGFRGREAEVLSNRANARVETGDLAGAEKDEQEALGIAREIHDLDAESLALHGLGSISERLNRPEKALEYLRQAREGWGALRAADAEARADSLMARVEGAMGRVDAGLADAEESIRLLESQRGSLGSEDLRAYFLASLGNSYQVKIDLLMKKNGLEPGMGFDRQAFETSERARARSLIELLAESHAGAGKGADGALLAQERALDRRVSAAGAKLRTLPPASEDFEKLRVSIEDLTAERERVDAEIRRQNPVYAAVAEPRRMSVEQVQNQVLGADTALLEYSLGAERSYLFRVTRTSFRAFELAKRSEIESAAKDFCDEVFSGVKGRTEFPKSAALGHLLLDAVAGEMAGQRLAVVGDGKLWEVPFGALLDPATGKRLIAGHEVAMEPSAAALAVIRQEAAGRKRGGELLAIVADPVFGKSDVRMKELAGEAGVGAAEDLDRLEYTRNEAEKLRGLAGRGKSVELMDFAASKKAVTSGRLANYEILHFATHGLIDERHAQLSGLALSMYDEKGEPVDGFLRVNDIFEMKLGARLVVLSACESGRGQLVGGEGLMGLTRGFFYAGAETVVASLWEVDDRATEELMSRFYREMLGGRRLAPAAALRAAQVWMMGRAEWSDPSYWAAFTVQGEWR